MTESPEAELNRRLRLYTMRLGATIEARYRWLDNEGVNLLATLTGAVVAVQAL